MTGISYLLFPELAALSYDVFMRPRGTWAMAPFLLVATPLITAVIGLLIEQHLGYSAYSVLLSIALALLVIRLLNSPIAPAIPAGLLPIFLEEKNWWYPAAIFFGTSVLVLTLLVYKKVFTGIIPNGRTRSNQIDDIVEQPPKQYSWLPFFTFFLLADAALAKLTGLRFIMFPPLVVIAFEMFAHSDVCPWANKPILLIAACTLAAAAGVSLEMSMGNNPLSVMLSMAVAMGLIRLFRLHAPPAVAVGLLPFVIERPGFSFPLAVSAGTLLLVGMFAIYRARSLRAG
jgi:CBS-domain-containing membrane protein